MRIIEAMKRPKKRYCKYCSVSCVWVWNGESLKDGSKIYIDANGNRWSGARCQNVKDKELKRLLNMIKQKEKLIIDSLIRDGFTIESRGYPIKASKDKKIYTVGIKHSSILENKEKELEFKEEDFDLYAVIFHSVKFCTSKSLHKAISAHDNC